MGKKGSRPLAKKNQRIAKAPACKAFSAAVTGKSRDKGELLNQAHS